MKKLGTTLLSLLFVVTAFAQKKPDPVKKLKGLDAYMEKLLKDWNCPGAGIGIVVDGKLVFSKGYGYRDYGTKAPVTSKTMFQIASNTKLFTTVAVGYLVNRGLMDWDTPIKKSVPTIEFFNDYLNNNVTLRDMLAHRTGITRHDVAWYKSDVTRAELYSRIKYLEPAAPMREKFLYNNLMYSAVGQIIEEASGKTWENVVRDSIFNPLEMPLSTFSIEDMKHSSNDYFVPYNQKKFSKELYKIPWYENAEGVGPAGSIISNVDEMSHWLIALMDNGMYKGKQVIPQKVIEASLQPSTVLPIAHKKDRAEVLN